MMMYRINDIYASVQGEGCLTGVPMVILRLHGCGVQCAFCDTKHTWALPSIRVATIAEALGENPKYIELCASEINAYIRQHYPQYSYVLVTGGEPSEQDLQALVNALHDGGYKVALETSGTAAGHLDAAFDWVCVSPKFEMPGGKPVLPITLERANEIKHVVGKAADIDTLEAALIGIKTGAQICLQPMSVNKKATELCIRTVQRKGWRLSIQTHKLLAIR